jgi:hypothetical protein
MKNSEIKSLIGASTVSKNENGNYVARWSYFYIMGRTTEKYRNLVQEKFPDCTIIDAANHWAAFRGGQSVVQGSHFYVEFKLNEEYKKEEYQQLGKYMNAIKEILDTREHVVNRRKEVNHP